MKPIKIHFVEEALQDYELLEMVNSGHIPATVLDSQSRNVAACYGRHIKAHTELPLRENGHQAWQCAKLPVKKIVNGYLRTAKSGTLLGNVIFEANTSTIPAINQGAQSRKLKRPDELAKIFTEYPINMSLSISMMAAQGFQELVLTREVSHKGRRHNAGYAKHSQRSERQYKNIEKVENNIHAGVKYMRFIKNR